MAADVPLSTGAGFLETQHVLETHNMIGNMLGDLFCGPFSPACCPFCVAEAGLHPVSQETKWLDTHVELNTHVPHAPVAMAVPLQPSTSPPSSIGASPSASDTMEAVSWKKFVSEYSESDRIAKWSQKPNPCEQNRLRSSKVLFGCSLIHIHRCVSRLVFRISGWKLKFFPPGVVFAEIFLSSNSGTLGPQPPANLWTMTGWNWVDPLLEHDSWRVHDPQQGSTGSSLYSWDLMRMGTYFQSQVVSLDSAQLILKLRRWSWKSPCSCQGDDLWQLPWSPWFIFYQRYCSFVFQ